MTMDPRLSRRQVIGGMAGGGAAAALGTGAGLGRLSEAIAARKAPAIIQGSGQLTYWGGLIFSEAANDLLVETINNWGSENGVETDVVMVNENETNQRVSAAVEAGTMPDALDVGLDLLLLLSTTEQLEDVTDVYNSIGEAQGGWFESIAGSVDPSLLGGVMTGVPYGAAGNLLNSRRDVLEAAELTPPPETWQELSDWARQTQEPPLFGMGFALSNVGDGNMQVSVMQSYGGRVADDEGQNCTIRSEETRAYLEWVTTAYADGLFPPGATIWDGAGDNTAYQSGQAIFIANPGSVYLGLIDADPELAEATAFSSLPAGPIGVISPLQPKVRSVPKTTRDVDAAKALITHLAEPDFMAEYYKVAIYGPVLQNQLEFDSWEDPVHAGLADLAQNGTAPAYPDVFNTAYADFNTNFIVPRMVQRVVVDGYSLDEAMDEAQEQGQLIYDKYD
jgi:multiple sugar transport system substrate-binding protein